jgi:hypothetical protein
MKEAAGAVTGDEEKKADGQAQQRKGAAGEEAAQNIPQQGLTAILSVSGILALLFPFIGGAIGGACGARVGQGRP